MHTEIGLRELAHESVHEFLHLDGKIFETLKLLTTTPGALTLEFLRGRRARYISPVRLYLTCSLLFFAINAVAPAPNEHWEVTATDAPTPEVREALRQAEEGVRDLREKFAHNAPRGMFVLMPTFALITWAFYRRTQPYYVPHLYYAIHFHAFVFLVFAVAKTCSFGGPPGRVIGGILALAVVPYHYLALGRVFGGSRRQIAWKGTAIGVVYTVVISALLFAILLVAIKRVIAGAGLHAS